MKIEVSIESYTPLVPMFFLKSYSGVNPFLDARLSSEYVSSPEFIYSRSSRPEVFCKNGVPRNLAKFTENFIKTAKNRLWHKCFPVNFAKFLTRPFLKEHLRWLLPFFPNTNTERLNLQIK